MPRAARGRSRSRPTSFSARSIRRSKRSTMTRAIPRSPNDRRRSAATLDESRRTSAESSARSVDCDVKLLPIRLPWRTPMADDEERAPDLYTNTVQFMVTPYEVTLVFGLSSEPNKPPKEIVRLRMSPQHALVMSKLLQKNLLG